MVVVVFWVAEDELIDDSDGTGNGVGVSDAGPDDLVDVLDAVGVWIDVAANAGPAELVELFVVMEDQDCESGERVIDMVREYMLRLLVVWVG